METRKPITSSSQLSQQTQSLAKRKTWTNEEDQILIKSVQSHGSDWKYIATLLPGRNPSQCAQRWKRIKPQKERNKKWTAEEDQQLLNLVKEYSQKWNLIAKMMVHRTGRQVRERYINHLDPSILKKGWTKKEDKILWKLFNQLGTKWSDISRLLPGRPENMIKNRFYSFVRIKYGKVQNPYYVTPNQGVRSGDSNSEKALNGFQEVKNNNETVPNADYEINEEELRRDERGGKRESFNINLKQSSFSFQGEGENFNNPSLSKFDSNCLNNFSLINYEQSSYNDQVENAEIDFHFGRFFPQTKESLAMRIRPDLLSQYHQPFLVEHTENF